MADQYTRERNLLSLISNVSLGGNMSKNAEQCRAIERTLRSHQVLRKVATGGKSLAKFQKKVFDMCAFKAAEPEQLYTIHMSALGLLQLLVQQIPASSLEEIAKKTMQQLVELSKNPANVNLSLRTKICEIHHALAIRLQELPSEVVRDVTSLFGQLIPSAIAALNDAAKVEGALSIESCQHVSHIVNAITVLISECQGTMRQYANKMEKACLSLLFKDGEDIDGNMRPVMQSAAICISMITKNYAKPAEADSNKQSMEWIDVRLNRCLLSLQAMINQAVSGSVSLNELQDFPIIHPVDIDYVSSYGSSITTFVGRFTRLSFLLESYIQRASETQVFFVKAFQPVFDRMLEFARVCLLINANEIGRESSISTGSEMPCAYLFAVLPEIQQIALRGLSQCIQAYGKRIMCRAQRVSNIIAGYVEKASSDETFIAACEALTECVKQLGPASYPLLVDRVLNCLIQLLATEFTQTNTEGLTSMMNKRFSGAKRKRKSKSGLPPQSNVAAALVPRIASQKLISAALDSIVQILVVCGGMLSFKQRQEISSTLHKISSVHGENDSYLLSLLADVVTPLATGSRNITIPESWRLNNSSSSKLGYLTCKAIETIIHPRAPAFHIFKTVETIQISKPVVQETSQDWTDSESETEEVAQEEEEVAEDEQEDELQVEEIKVTEIEPVAVAETVPMEVESKPEEVAVKEVKPEDESSSDDEFPDIVDDEDSD